MTTYDFVHLVVRAAGDKVQGRTKLQKLVYFAGEITGFRDQLGYRPHYFGPYSPDVAAAVEELRGLRFLEQRLAPSGTIDPQGFEVTRYDYVLTDEGRMIADEKAALSTDMWSRIQGAVAKFTATDYVKLSIAAKTFFLLGEVDEYATPERLQAMTGQFGWKNITGDQILEAGRFLESVGLIHFRGGK